MYVGKFVWMELIITSMDVTMVTARMEMAATGWVKLNLAFGATMGDLLGMEIQGSLMTAGHFVVMDFE